MPTKSIAKRFAWNAIQLANTYRNRRSIARRDRTEEPPPIEPVWPLPRHAGSPSDDEIRAEFDRHQLWHYAYEFTGGLEFSASNVNPTKLTQQRSRPLQRFRHFMPWLLNETGGSLEGKRVLDIACNSGFWSMQCALLGAKQVVGFDAREELIEEANLVKAIVGADNAEFKVMDFWDMSPETLGGQFDVVLNLGILYHLPKPVEALEITKSVARDLVLLDTTVLALGEPLVSVRWEEPRDIRDAATAGICMSPSKSSMNLILRHLQFSKAFEIPLRTTDMPPDYLSGRRASWLLRV